MSTSRAYSATSTVVDGARERVSRVRNRSSEAFAAGYRHGQANQMGTVTMLIGVVAAVVIGVFLVAELNSAIPSISNTNLSNGRTAVVSDFGSAIELFGPFFIVVVAGLILGVVSQLRG